MLADGGKDMSSLVWNRNAEGFLPALLHSDPSPPNCLRLTPGNL